MKIPAAMRVSMATRTSGNAKMIGATKMIGAKSHTNHCLYQVFGFVRNRAGMFESGRTTQLRSLGPEENLVSLLHFWCHFVLQMEEFQCAPRRKRARCNQTRDKGLGAIVRARADWCQSCPFAIMCPLLVY